MNRLLTVGLVFSALVMGCGGLQGPRVRFAKASEAELRAVAEQNIVWYEFQPGDAVPLHFAVLGVAEAAGEPMALEAKRPFYIVMRKGLPPAFSFDGESLHFQSGQTFLALGHEKGTNQIMVLTYVGKPDDLPAELKALK